MGKAYGTYLNIISSNKK